MAFLAALAWLWAWVGAAGAVDAHGAAVAPCALDEQAPLVALAPGLGQGRAWSACATVEAASEPVVATVTDAQGTRSYAALDDLVGLHVGASYGFGPAGLALDLPLWLASTGDDVANGPALGDLRFYVPVSLVRATAARRFGFDAVVEVVAPTGATAPLLGAGGVGVGTHLVFGGGSGDLSGTVDVGVGYAGGGSLAGLETALWTRLAVAGAWRAHPRFTLGAEGWVQAAPLSGATFAFASPGEALLRASTPLPANLVVSLAGGTAITPGVGAADARMYLRLGLGQKARGATLPNPDARTAETPAGPFDVLVSVRDPDGRPLDAELSWSGPGAPPPAPAGADGEARATLQPGEFLLSVSRPGFGTQRRDFVLTADRFRPERVSVVLHPTTGEATLRVGVEDGEGRRVDDARVNVDGLPFGTTSTGGTLEVDGFGEGRHTVLVEHPDFRAPTPVEVALPQGATAARIVLERPPGSVTVITRGAAGPVPDARVRFQGPEDLAAEDVGPDGERTFVLLPGHWVVVASAQALGTQEREFEVETGKTALVLIEVRMREGEAGTGRLVVRVVDPAGAPVDGAEVLVDGVSVGRTANEGTLTLGDLRAGARAVQVRADRFRESPPREVELAAATRELLVPLAWRPGQVHLVARGVEGAMVDARVRFSGPEELPPANLGPDGEAWFELALGRWTVAIASATYGVQEREIVVTPDDVTLVDMAAGLLTADGDATLVVRVLDDARRPLAGAALTFDRRAVGTTASGGLAELGGLGAGKHELVVEAEGMKPRAHTIRLGGGRTELEVELDALARRVDLHATGPDGPATDALVRGYGADVLPPVQVDASGARELLLEPGPWTLVAVSERLGIAERDVDVKKSKEPLRVELTLRPPASAQAALLVEVVDPSGRPVPGATLAVDGADRPLGPTGVALIEGRPRGPVRLAARAPGYRDGGTEVVDLGAGVQTRRLRLEWVPRAVEVRVHDDAGNTVDAEVRAFGPGRVTPLRSGTEGARFVLGPGAWQVVAAAPGYGPWRRDVEVPAGVVAIRIDAVLAAEKVEVTRTSVVIREQVRFAFDKADIEESSYALLEQVASTLLLHPEITRIEVQGHTDNRGAEVYNLDLSQRRAEAVRAFLVRRGVEPARIEARGYGTSRPVSTNDSEAGRARNRRVQFEIVPPAP